MTPAIVLGRVPRRSVRHFSSQGLSLMLDERAHVALTALAIRTGAPQTAVLLVVLGSGPRDGRTARTKLVAEYRRAFGSEPSGASMDRPRDNHWPLPVKRIYQDAYSLAYRAEMARTGDREAAREAGREAGRKAVRSRGARRG